MERVEGGRTRLKDRRLFLFEHALVLSKKRRDDSDQENYLIKETLKVCTSTMDESNTLELTHIQFYNFSKSLDYLYHLKFSCVVKLC